MTQATKRKIEVDRRGSLLLFYFNDGGKIYVAERNCAQGIAGLSKAQEKRLNNLTEDDRTAVVYLDSTMTFQFK